MKTRSVASIFEREEHITLLTGFSIFGLLALVIILLITFWPTSQSTFNSISVPEVSLPVHHAPVSARMQKRPKTMVLTDKPAGPVPVAVSPAPTPLPAGGGILRKIAFVSNRADGRHYQIYMMDADGNGLERVTDSEAFDRDPHFSNDGTRLAFTSNRSGTYQIYIMDIRTRAIRQLTQGPADKTNPFWSPDDRHVLYTLNQTGSCELGMIDADGKNSHVVVRSRGNNYGYGFAPNGRWISYVSTVNNRNEIFALDLKTEQSRLLVQTDELTFRGDPVFSPVGNKLIFSSNALDHSIRQLYLYDLDWKKYYRLTEDELDKDDPIFSPDGTRVAYVALWENAWNIFVMDTDGRHARNLTMSYYDNLVPTWR